MAFYRGNGMGGSSSSWAPPQPQFQPQPMMMAPPQPQPQPMMMAPPQAQAQPMMMAPPQAQPQSMMMAQPQPMMMMPPPSPPPQPRPWTKAEDKVFEALLVRFPENLPNRWIYVAAQLPGRNAQEAWEHYQALVADVDLIERGLIETPDSWDDEDAAGGGGSGSGGGRGRGRSGSGEERRRGVPWSEEEHRYAARGGSRRQNRNFPLLVFFVIFPCYSGVRSSRS
jgi:hypothetical protein